MAVVCAVVAGGGFVGAGYANASTADAAFAASSNAAFLSEITKAQENQTSLDSFAGGIIGGADLTGNGLGGLVAGKPLFGQTMALAEKPAKRPVINLTRPSSAPGSQTGPLTNVDYKALGKDFPKYSRDFISQVRKDILDAARQGLGHSYVWGGTSFANGWDCSGFVQWAYAQAGVSLPRTEQWQGMIPTDKPQPGDLVAQNPDGPNHWAHVGIYLGNGQMISALNPSVGTIISTPQAISSSSTFFTMPGFAAADTKAESDAKASASKSAKPSAKPSNSHGSTSKPGTTSPSTTKPHTPSNTPKPSTGGPSTGGPTTSTPSGPATTVPPTTHPTTPPTSPGTTPPTSGPVPSGSPSSGAPVDPETSGAGSEAGPGTGTGPDGAGDEPAE